MANEFERELTSLLNRHSKENASNTPDFILASYLLGCLATFNEAVNRRANWYGKEDKPTEISNPLPGTVSHG